MCRSSCQSFLILDGLVSQSDVFVVVDVVDEYFVVVVVVAKRAWNQKMQDFCRSPEG